MATLPYLHQLVLCCLASISTSSHLLLTCCLLLVVALAYWVLIKQKPICIVDFACFQPPHMWRISSAFFLEHSKLTAGFNNHSLEFQKKVLERSGLGEFTALPMSLHYIPPRINIDMEYEESEAALVGALDELFSYLPVNPQQISVLVINCSIFSPTPSLCSMIVNRYKLREDIKTFNLAGMGCAAGVISLDVARNILRVHPNTYALVLSTENLTRNWYFGNERSKLVTNCLFRVGASAVLLSNMWKDYRRAKYEVKHILTAHGGGEDKSYKSVFQEEDDQGMVGVSMSKELMDAAAAALENNMKRLGPKVLPNMEILLYVVNLVMRKLFQANIKPYLPDFKLAFHHICIHAGGKAVISKIQRSLDLPPESTESSYMTLQRFGNVSSSSIWYALAYEEAKGKMKAGNRVWQIGLGGGFKCCSCVLHALRTIQPKERSCCWSDFIFAPKFQEQNS